MNDYFVWKEDELGIGVPTMDEEHKILIQKMNILYSSFNDSAPPVVIEENLQDLRAYIVKHFADEEKHIHSMGHVELETHKFAHKKLLLEFDSYMQGHKKNGVLGPEFFGFLKVWLNRHINVIDRQYSTTKI